MYDPWETYTSEPVDLCLHVRLALEPSYHLLPHLTIPLCLAFFKLQEANGQERQGEKGKGSLQGA